MSPKRAPAPPTTDADNDLFQAALPSPALLTQQAAWLAPARARLLRQIHIARRKRVLDLGAGHGSVVAELQRRAGGSVIALDLADAALRGPTLQQTPRVAAHGLWLPFPDDAFDLVFSQITLLWISPLNAVVREIWRTLMPGGVLIALEPDYGGMIEYPPEVSTQELWLHALKRAGADPHAARKLPGLLCTQGFDVRVNLFDTLNQADENRFAFLADLPLTAPERQRLTQAQREAKALTAPWSQIAHLPFFLIRATKPT